MKTHLIELLGSKFSFMANVVIPILIHFCYFLSNWRVVSHMPSNDNTCGQTISDSMLQITNVIQSDYFTIACALEYKLFVFGH